MKFKTKILLITFVSLSLISCQTREDKAAALIDKEMYKTLVDYESYQPVETVVDSAFFSPVTNPIFVEYAKSAYNNLMRCNAELEKAKYAKQRMDIWDSTLRSVFGRSQYDSALKEFESHLALAKDYHKQAIDLLTQIYNEAQEMPTGFCGWKAKHTFRCKNRGGDAIIATYIYYIDSEMKSILYCEDASDEELSNAKGYIEYALSENGIEKLSHLLDQL